MSMIVEISNVIVLDKIISQISTGILYNVYSVKLHAKLVAEYIKITVLPAILGITLCWVLVKTVFALGVIIL